MYKKKYDTEFDHDFQIKLITIRISGSILVTLRSCVSINILFDCRFSLFRTQTVVVFREINNFTPKKTKLRVISHVPDLKIFKLSKLFKVYGSARKY